MRKLVVESPSQPTDPNIKAFEEHINGKYPKYNWEEYLKLIIAILKYKDEHGKNPRTSDLASALSIENEKVCKYARIIGSKYIERSGRTVFLSIEGEFYFGREEMQEGFISHMEELREFLHNGNQSDGLESLYSKADSLMTQGDLFAAVKKYNQVIHKLNGSNNSHNLSIVMVRSTAYRYNLSAQGETLARLVMARQPGPDYLSPGTHSPGPGYLSSSAKK